MFFSPFAAGRFIFLGSDVTVFNAGSVIGSGETENLSPGTICFISIEEAC